MQKIKWLDVWQFINIEKYKTSRWISKFYKNVEFIWYDLNNMLQFKPYKDSDIYQSLFIENIKSLSINII